MRFDELSIKMYINLSATVSTLSVGCLLFCVRMRHAILWAYLASDVNVIAECVKRRMCSGGKQRIAWPICFAFKHAKTEKTSRDKINMYNEKKKHVDRNAQLIHTKNDFRANWDTLAVFPKRLFFVLFQMCINLVIGWFIWRYFFPFQWMQNTAVARRFFFDYPIRLRTREKKSFSADMKSNFAPLIEPKWMRVSALNASIDANLAWLNVCIHFFFHSFHAEVADKILQIKKRASWTEGHTI